MLDVFFADDATQNDPSRPGLEPLVATGFVHVPGEQVRDLEESLNEICGDAGFPNGDAGEFKWSPGKDLWMRKNLVEGDRKGFFNRVLTEARNHDAQFTVVVDEVAGRTATGTDNHEMDVTTQLLERAQWQLEHEDRTGLVVVDRPSGDRADETDFLRRCLETLTEGTAYLDFDRIACNVVSTPSKLIRCLQLADLITSCTIARVGGEDPWSPPVFEVIRAGLVTRRGRTEGVGLKIHPTLRLMNLYHWLLDVTVLRLRARGEAYALPHDDRPYAEDPMER